MAIDRSSKSLFRFLGRLIKKCDRRKVVVRILDEEDYQLSIANTRLVSSYGLIATCAIRPEHPKSSSIDLEYLNDLPRRISLVDSRALLSIYICSDALIQFAKVVLPKINRDFILVSGDSDLMVNSDNLQGGFEAILENPNLISWYAQNKSQHHSKLFSLPIGLDFHSKWVDPEMWGSGSLLPSIQELELRSIFSRSLIWGERIPKAYCDWMFHLERGDRAECKDRAEPQACFFLEEPLSRLNTWGKQSRYAFVLSPSGAGPDCHRTWEALALGCVPIVKKYAFSDLFQDLPVLIINDWSEVTESFLRDCQSKLQYQEFDYSKLMLNYWKFKIHRSSEAKQFLPRMTIEQFRKFNCA